MFTPSQLEQLPIPIERLMSNMEMNIMQDIIRRIKINDEITRSADWQIYRLVQMGQSKRAVKKMIKVALGLSNKEINHLYKDVIRQGYAWDESLYKAKGKTMIPFDENTELQQLIQATIQQAKAEMVNITQTMGFAVEMGGKQVFTPLSQFLQQALDNVVMDVISGTFDYNSSLKRVVQQMTKSGLRTVDYASGYSNRVEVAARRALMTGVNQVTGKINDDNAKRLGTNKFEVSWHATARPTHQVWQGRVFTKKQLIDVCGLGTGPGLLGWNCYHTYWPFIEGVSVRTYTDEQLDKMNAAENKPKKYNGKEYTSYEATQRQRQLETLMRKQRQDIKLLKDGEGSADDIQAAQIRYRETMRQYRLFSDEMKLPQQRERVYMDGLGRVDPGGKLQTGLKDAAGNSIIKANRSDLQGPANSITQVTHKKGGIDRNYYNATGKQYKQISNNNHDKPKNHPFGVNGEHAHDYQYDEKGELLGRPARDLTELERKENADIL